MVKGMEQGSAWDELLQLSLAMAGREAVTAAALQGR